MSANLFGYEAAKKWDYENGFYLTSHPTRITKLLSHYELYKSICDLPGQVVECGVFKGTSLIRFATFRAALEHTWSRQIIGFDAFGSFPVPGDEEDQEWVREFEEEAGEGISRGELDSVFASKGFENYRLVEGDIRETVPEYLEHHPELKIALLHIDVDVGDASRTILEHLYSRVVGGGVVVLDDYGTVAGETRAVDEFFDGRNVRIEKHSISHVPSFVRKSSG